MSERPKDGIYLDATLAVIGEQLEERIEEVSRGRRLRLRLGVAALAIATIASGSVAAVALTTRVTDAAAEASVTLTAPGEIHCVDGMDADRPAYFTARFRTADDVEVDAAALCGAARTAIATDDGAIEGAAPAELATIAGTLVAAAAHEPASDDTEPVATEAVAVDLASFGRLSASGGPHMIVCALDEADMVFASPYGEPPTDAQRAAACAGASR